jgi:hypothetical protein
MVRASSEALSVELFWAAASFFLQNCFSPPFSSSSSEKFEILSPIAALAASRLRYTYLAVKDSMIR